MMYKKKQTLIEISAEVTYIIILILLVLFGLQIL
jgi:hypothetical protein